MSERPTEMMVPCASARGGTGRWVDGLGLGLGLGSGSGASASPSANGPASSPASEASPGAASASPGRLCHPRCAACLRCPEAFDLCSRRPPQPDTGEPAQPGSSQSRLGLDRCGAVIALARFVTFIAYGGVARRCVTSAADEAEAGDANEE